MAKVVFNKLENVYDYRGYIIIDNRSRTGDFTLTIISPDNQVYVVNGSEIFTKPKSYRWSRMEKQFKEEIVNYMQKLIISNHAT